MILHPTTVSTDLFSYDPDNRTFFAEDSDLPRPSRIWDDACDTGYTLVSARTGKEVIVAITSEMRRDGDILYWVLQPIARNERDMFTVHIFND
jgi:hypothetical protein